MSRIDDAQENIKNAREILSGEFDRDVHKAHVRGLLKQAADALRLAKAEQAKSDMVGAVILREGRELKLYAQGFGSGYLRISMGDDGIFNIRNVLVDEVGGDIAEIKVDEWKPAPMKLQGVPCVNPNCHNEFVAAIPGRVLACAVCKWSQVPVAKGADDA